MGIAESLPCRPYGVTMTPWRCVENQLSEYCLPGWPCHECDQAVTIIPKIKPKPMKKPRLPAWLKNATAAVRRDYLKGK